MQVSVSRLTKVFSSRSETVRALNEVTLVAPARRILTLLGPSGCGKTTLLRCIAGLETPDSGEILIGNKTVWSAERGLSIPPERRRIGMVFQSYAIWPHMTVFDNVAYPLKIRKVPRHEILRRVKAVLDMVQLHGLENRPATRLSGGQQQRVALARALVAEPEVILFDEPLSNLDAKLRETTRQELRAFLKELAISAIYVTHDRVEALAISDEIAVMRDGQIVEQGKPLDLYFRSNNPFVVDFIGRANFFTATLLRYEKSGYAVVSSPLGTLRCASVPDLPLGTEVTIYFRPETIEVVAQGEEGGENEFEGVVVTVLFTGEAWEARILVGKEHLTAKLDLTTPVREGEKIRLRVKPQWCRVLQPKAQLQP